MSAQAQPAQWRHYHAKSCLAVVTCRKLDPVSSASDTCTCGHAVSMHLLHPRNKHEHAEQLFAAIRNTRCAIALVVALHCSRTDGQL